jgi:hypothetical protein
MTNCAHDWDQWQFIFAYLLLQLSIDFAYNRLNNALFLYLTSDRHSDFDPRQIISIFGSTDKGPRRTDGEEEPETRRLFRTYMTLELVISAI